MLPLLLQYLLLRLVSSGRYFSILFWDLALRDRGERAISRGDRSRYVLGYLFDRFVIITVTYGCWLQLWAVSFVQMLLGCWRFLVMFFKV